MTSTSNCIVFTNMTNGQEVRDREAAAELARKIKKDNPDAKITMRDAYGKDTCTFVDNKWVRGRIK